MALGADRSLSTGCMTFIAVAGFVGKVRGPAASGKPYIKG